MAEELEAPVAEGPPLDPPNKKKSLKELAAERMSAGQPAGDKRPSLKELAQQRLGAKAPAEVAPPADPFASAPSPFGSGGSASAGLTRPAAQKAAPPTPGGLVLDRPLPAYDRFGVAIENQKLADQADEVKRQLAANPAVLAESQAEITKEAEEGLHRLALTYKDVMEWAPPQQAQEGALPMLDPRWERVMNEYRTEVQQQFTPSEIAARREAGTWGLREDARERRRVFDLQQKKINERSQSLRRTYDALSATRNLDNEVAALQQEGDALERERGELDSTVATQQQADAFNARLQAYQERQREYNRLFRPVLQEQEYLGAWQKYVTEGLTNADALKAMDSRERDLLARQLNADATDGGGYTGTAHRFFRRLGGNIAGSGLRILNLVGNAPNRALGKEDYYSVFTELADRVDGALERIEAEKPKSQKSEVLSSGMEDTPAFLQKTGVFSGGLKVNPGFLHKLLDGALYAGALAAGGYAAGARGMAGLGLVASSEDYYRDGVESGLKPQDAEVVALLLAGTEASIEALNLGPFVNSGARKGIMAGAVDAIRKGAAPKVAAKESFARYVTGQVVAESGEEMFTAAGQAMVKKGAEIATGVDQDTELTASGLAGDALMGGVIGGLMGGVGRLSQRPLYKEGVAWAVQNADEFRRHVAQNVPKEQQAAILERFDLYEKVYRGLPANMSSDARMTVAHAVAEKERLKKEQKEIISDPMVTAVAGNPIEDQIAANDELIKEALGEGKDESTEKGDGTGKTKDEGTAGGSAKPAAPTTAQGAVLGNGERGDATDNVPPGDVPGAATGTVPPGPAAGAPLREGTGGGIGTVPDGPGAVSTGAGSVPGTLPGDTGGRVPPPETPTNEAPQAGVPVDGDKPWINDQSRFLDSITGDNADGPKRQQHYIGDGEEPVAQYEKLLNEKGWQQRGRNAGSVWTDWTSPDGTTRVRLSPGSADGKIGSNIIVEPTGKKAVEPGSDGKWSPSENRTTRLVKGDVRLFVERGDIGARWTARGPDGAELATGEEASVSKAKKAAEAYADQEIKVAEQARRKQSKAVDAEIKAERKRIIKDAENLSEEELGAHGIALRFLATGGKVGTESLIKELGLRDPRTGKTGAEFRSKVWAQQRNAPSIENVAERIAESSGLDEGEVRNALIDILRTSHGRNSVIEQLREFLPATQDEREKDYYNQAIDDDLIERHAQDEAEATEARELLAAAAAEWDTYTDEQKQAIFDELDEAAQAFDEADAGATEGARGDRVPGREEGEVATGEGEGTQSKAAREIAEQEWQEQREALEKERDNARREHAKAQKDFERRGGITTAPDAPAPAGLVDVDVDASQDNFAKALAEKKAAWEKSAKAAQEHIKNREARIAARAKALDDQIRIEQAPKAPAPKAPDSGKAWWNNEATDKQKQEYVDHLIDGMTDEQLGRMVDEAGDQIPELKNPDVREALKTEYEPGDIVDLLEAYRTTFKVDGNTGVFTDEADFKQYHALSNKLAGAQMAVAFANAPRSQVQAAQQALDQFLRPLLKKQPSYDAQDEITNPELETPRTEVQPLAAPEAKPAAAPTTGNIARTQADKAAVKARMAERLKRMGKGGTLSSGGLSPQMIEDLVGLIGDLVELGYLSMKQVAQQLKALGMEEYMPGLKDAYRRFRDTFTGSPEIKYSLDNDQAIEEAEAADGADKGPRPAKEKGTKRVGSRSLFPGTGRNIRGSAVKAQEARPPIRIAGEQALATPKQERIAQGRYPIDEHQRLGANLALERFADGHKAFMLGDGVGVGKTREILAIAEEYRKATGERVLIITKDRRILEDSFAKDSEAMGIDLGNFTVGIYNDLTAKEQPIRGEYGLVIYDESHMLKNFGSLRAQASERLKARHVAFVTATPFDKPETSIRYLRDLTGMAQQELMQRLGLEFYTFTDQHTGEVSVATKLTKGKNHYWNAVRGIRDELVAQGAFVRREFPFFGDIEFAKAQAPAALAKDIHEVQAIANRIEENYEYEVLSDWANKRIRARGGSIQAEQKAERNALKKLLEAEDSATAEEFRQRYARWLGNERKQQIAAIDKLNEVAKVASAVERTKEALANGEKVILVVQGVNDQNPSYGRDDREFKGRKNPNPWRYNEYGHFKKTVPGAGAQLREALKAAGIGHGVIYGSSNDMAAFNNGDIDVLVITAASGGTGINLDDRVGDAPRRMIMLTPPWGGDTFEQLIGRVSRRTTMSASAIEVLGFDGNRADDSRKGHVVDKRKTLLAINEGADPDEVRVMQDDDTDADAEEGGAQAVADPGAGYVPSRGKQTRNDPAQKTFDFDESLDSKAFGAIPYGSALGTDADSAAGGDVQRQADQVPSLLRKLKPGEKSWAERRFASYKQIKLTARSFQVRSNADVAFIFRALENQATENLFYVFAKDDGSFLVQYVSTGSQTGTFVDHGQAAATASAWGATKVWVVHNHPSGQLRASGPDQKTYAALRRGLPDGIELQPGIVINLDSGQYLLFDEHNEVLERPFFDAADKPVAKVKAITRSRKVVLMPTSEDSTIGDERAAALFVSRQKRSGAGKGLLVILNAANHVMAVTALQHGLTSTKPLMAQIARDNSQFAGLHVVVAINRGAETISHRQHARALAEGLGDLGIRLTDVLVVGEDPQIAANYTSLKAIGMLAEEPGAERGRVAEPAPVGSPSTGTAAEVQAMFDKQRDDARAKRKRFGRRVYEAWVRGFEDKQGLAKERLRDEGADDVATHITLTGGASGEARFRYDAYKKAVFGGLSTRKRELLNDIIQARTTISIDTRFDDNGKPRPKSPDGKHKEHHEAWLKDLEQRDPKLHADMNKRADAYFEAMRDMLRMKHDDGVITQELHDKLVNFEYSPRQFIHHLFDDEQKMQLDTVDQVGTGIRKLAAGSEESLFNDAEWLLANQVASAHRLSFRNRTNKALLDFVRAKDTPLGYELKRTGPTSFAKPKTGYQEVTVYEDGKERRIALANEVATEWLNNDPIIQHNAANTIRVLTLGSLFRMSITGANPAFALANLPRDVAHVLMFTDTYSGFFPKGLAQITADMARVAVDVFRRKGRFLEYIDEGGSMDFLSRQGMPLTHGRIGKASAIKGVGEKVTDALLFFAEKLLSIIQYINESSELIVRLAIREREIAKGTADFKLHNGREPNASEAKWIKEQATAAARDQMDFNQGGKWSKAIDNFVPYFNATLQGTRVMARYAKTNPWKFAGKMAQLGAFATSLVLYNMGYEDDWERIPDAEKENYWILFMPWKVADRDGQMQRRYYKLAKSHDQRIFASFFEGLAELNKTGKWPTERSVMSLREAMPIGPTNLIEVPIANGVWSYISGFDTYTGEYVLNTREKLEPWAEYNSRTPSLYKRIAEMTSRNDTDGMQVGGVSPARLDLAVKKGTGLHDGNIWFNLVAKPVNLVLEATGASEREELEKEMSKHLEEVAAPFARRISGMTRELEATDILDRYDRRENTRRKVMNDTVKSLLAERKRAETEAQKRAVDRTASRLFIELGPDDQKRALKRYTMGKDNEDIPYRYIALANERYREVRHQVFIEWLEAADLDEKRRLLEYTNRLGMWNTEEEANQIFDAVMKRRAAEKAPASP